VIHAPSYQIPSCWLQEQAIPSNLADLRSSRQGSRIVGYKELSFKERQTASAAAKKAILEKHRQAENDPSRKDWRAKRTLIHEARVIRAEKRAAAKSLKYTQETEEAQRALAAEEAAEHQRLEAAARIEVQEAARRSALEAEQKAARDARYAAREAAKKHRRRGY
jgi:hypothetical protein